MMSSSNFASEKYCILRLGRSSWFALPATSVREVAPRPVLVPVPGAAPLLAGLCHLRNEFLPLVRLGLLVDESETGAWGDAQLVVLSGSTGPWGLLVDDVVALEPLEVSIRDTGRSHQAATAVMGSATYGELSVRVLDPCGLYQLARDLLMVPRSRQVASGKWQVANDK